MAGNKKASLGSRLVAVLISLIVVAGIFSVAFSRKGDQLSAIINAAIPVGSGVLAAAVLGGISKLSHQRWIIYLVVLIAVAVYVLLRLFRIL